VGLAADLMREAGLRACQPRAYKPTTIPGKEPVSRPDLIGRDFTAQSPGTRMVGDITYLRTGEGWLYLAVIEHGSRRVRVLGAIEHLVQAWVVQQARNQLMDLEDTGTRVKFVLHDRDASFTAAFDAVFQAAGVRIVRSGVQAPRMNSVMERWIGSCRRELLDRTLIWNKRYLMIVLREYEDF